MMAKRDEPGMPCESVCSEEKEDQRQEMQRLDNGKTVGVKPDPVGVEEAACLMMRIRRWEERRRTGGCVMDGWRWIGSEWMND
jgi:hypothetical protein